MGQIVFNGQTPKYCNLTAITTGSKKDYLIPDGEIWLIDSTNTSKTDGTGKYDYYIKGDGSKTASQLAENKIKIDDNVAPADGVGIASVVQTTTSSEDGGTNVITVTKTDNTTSTFTVKNGSKGSTGERGPQGETGPQGERGLPGESGVSGDVSAFTVRQTIDPSATYGATDIAGAAALQAANAELTELAGEVTDVEDTTIENPQYDLGVVKTNGTIESSTSYGIVKPIEMLNGDTIILNLGNDIYHGYSVAVLFKCSADGTFIETLISGNGATNPESWTNNTGETIYVGICTYKAQTGYIIRRKIALKTSFNKIKDSLGYLDSFSFDVAAGSTTPTNQQMTVNIPTGMRFYVEVDDSLGDGNSYTLFFLYDGQSSRTEIQHILSGTKYEFVATQGISGISVWKSAVDTNKTVSINVWTATVGGTEFLLGKFEEISSQQYELLLEGSADFLQICTKNTNKYAATANGSIYTYTGLDLYTAKIPNGVKSFRIYIAGKDSGSAAVAFYSSEAQSASTFISAVANTAQAQMIEVEIPNGAVSVAFTNYPTTLATPVIRAVGVDYVKAEDFGNSVKVVTQDIFSETYPHVNVLPIADYVSAKWIRKTDGVPVQSDSYLGYYKITIEDWMKKVVVKSYVSDSNPAAIAFYSSDTPSSDTYLSSSSVPSIAGTNYYYSDIPANAVCFCVTHRNDRGDALPIIEVTGQGGVSKGYIDQIVGSKLIASRSAAGVTGSSILETINLSQYENGTHFLLKMIDASGTKNKILGYLPNANSRTFFLKRVETGGNYYFDKTSEFTSIRLYCASGTNEVMDYELYVVSNSPHNNNVLMQPDTTSLEQNSINLGKPLQGAYWITPTTTYGDGAWVCFQIQYSRGYSIHLNIDFETYYLALKMWESDLSTYSEIRITAETDYYIPLYIAAWHIQVRRLDRAVVAAETVVNALTCTFVSGSGHKWEKPAPVSYVESLFNEVKQTASALTQVGNPFVNKPWYAHYSPNGFIKDGNGNNVIASESLADIEMAARLGFSFIEANIQSTSDGNYIVTHGSGGTFGPEVKSIDESVITTADLQATAINSKTLDWINTYVRYNSTLAKYQTTIPTLEEFCECCKENNIGVFGGSNQKDAIDTMVRYLGKDNVIVYGPPANIRSYFSGMVFTWNNSSGTTPDTLLANAKSYGAPYMCGIGPTLYSELVANNNLKQFLESMHYNGFLVGHSYLSEADAREAFRSGFDFSAADHDVNPFKGDKVYDLDGNASDFTTTGTIANNVATLASGQTISCGSSDVLALAKCSLSIRFTGSLTISLGSKWSSNRTITSDGSELIVITDYCYRRNTVLAITATASTTITELVYKYAIC